jgi:hypothetical protein
MSAATAVTVPTRDAVGRKTDAPARMVAGLRRGNTECRPAGRADILDRDAAGRLDAARDGMDTGKDRPAADEIAGGNLPSGPLKMSDR